MTRLAFMLLFFFALFRPSWTSAEEPQSPAAEQPQATIVDSTAADSQAGNSPSESNVVLAQRRHLWGRFSPGAWSLVRVVNETFDENSAVASTGMTQYRTTLLEIEDDGVTLQREASAWISGKRMDAKPQTLKQCFHGGLCGDNVKVVELPPIKMTVNGKQIPCKVELAELLDGNLRTTVHTYYNDDISPFVFKRISETVDLDKDAALVTRVTIEVDALDMPCAVLDEIRSAAHVRIVRKQANGSCTTTLAYMSPQIPGGTIRHSSKEVDSNGRVVSRSILELTDFGTEPEEEQRVGIFKRRREPARFHRTGLRSLPFIAE